ncbi:hypothetical protein CVIRNUC_010082 [Coccomyxa viridis]|uniref:Spt4/RpoE2 zinc finger domain-containing protein n=1 Tax=Coccomyxa viridis TaxID=1274662 RepID=A0AAV1ILN8_9CHLO|nr:hypothetical protein CVIRNUC_010082 [Coccomyxa viridis]
MAAAAEQLAQGHAEVPKDWGKNLVACMHCKLVKTEDQFYDNGCENCLSQSMMGDAERVQECTTNDFQGLVTILNPGSSWTARWLHIAKCKPGVYALAVAGEDIVSYEEPED